MRWIRGGIAEKIEGEVALAIDGKTVRRNYEKGDPKAALHMFSAWASEQRLVLAQQKVDGKTNEIGALPDLLEVLDLQGCTVTIDAMKTQRHIAAEITEQGGDYALALKGNQKKLYREVREYFEEGFERGFEGIPVTCADTTDIGHGRKERRLWVSSDVEWLPKVEDWPQVSSIALIQHERDTYEEKSIERRFYISSLSCEAEELMRVIRSHWDIEKSVHWVLDVVFREDESRIRRDHGGENMKVLRHAALNLLRQAGGEEDMSLRMKRKRAGWDDSFVDDLVDF